MVREKVLDKEKAILEAAISVFAERGFWNTPTSMISKTAGIADGTLFTYFATKDDLIQALYLAIKHEVAEELMTTFGDHTSVRDKMYHIWSRYIEWGVSHPERNKVMQQIHSSYALSEDVKAQALEPFKEIGNIAQDSIASGLVPDYPVDYLAALMNSQIETTITFINLHPDQMAYYMDIGFEILWNGMTR